MDATQPPNDTPQRTTVDAEPLDPDRWHRLADLLPTDAARKKVLRRLSEKPIAGCTRQLPPSRGGKPEWWLKGDALWVVDAVRRELATAGDRSQPTPTADASDGWRELVAELRARVARLEEDLATERRTADAQRRTSDAALAQVDRARQQAEGRADVAEERVDRYAAALAGWLQALRRVPLWSLRRAVADPPLELRAAVGRQVTADD